MLNTKALVELFDKLRLCPYTNRFSGDDQVGDGFLVHKTPKGTWTVYSLERGVRSGVVEFPTEHVACRAYLQQFRDEIMLPGESRGVLKLIKSVRADGTEIDWAHVRDEVDQLLKKSG